MSPTMWKDSLKAPPHPHLHQDQGEDQQGPATGIDRLREVGEVNIGHVGREAVLGGPVLRQPCGTDGLGAVQPGPGAVQPGVVQWVG